MKTILTIILSLLFACSGFAQDKPKPVDNKPKIEKKEASKPKPKEGAVHKAAKNTVKGTKKVFKGVVHLFHK